MSELSDLIMKMPVLSLKDVIDGVRNSCDGTFSEDCREWDCPPKADVIINNLIRIATNKINKNGQSNY